MNHQPKYAYFMDVNSDDIAFITEVLVGCNRCNIREFTKTADEAMNWREWHHRIKHTKDDSTNIELLGFAGKTRF